jgi:acetyltransferase-like isoleucine patch superfamily enzyme
MTKVSTLAPYQDEDGNTIEYTGQLDTGISVEFTGSGNRLVVNESARIGSLSVHFNCDNGYVEIGPSSGVPAFSANLRVGQDSRIVIGPNVSCTNKVGMSAVEGTSITVGPDVMFASDNQVRTDDGHPIFDVVTGKRVNVSASIDIGAHVWVAWGAMLLAGSTVGEGSVVGMGAIVKGRFPNNCVIAGVPARVVRRDIAWERPHLSLVKPFYKPDASSVTKSRYWHLTRDPDRRGRRSARQLVRGALRRMGLRPA